MTAPLVRKIWADAPPDAAITDTLLTEVGEAPFAGVVSSASIIAATAQSGADTHSRTYNLYNRGAAGTGTTLVATLALVSGVNLVANDEKALTLSATAANLVVAAGDVLEFESLAVGNGLSDPGGLVQVEITRS